MLLKPQFLQDRTAPIERVLEGGSQFVPLGGDTRAHPPLRPDRAAGMLGLACALAMGAGGYFGLGVLHAFGATGPPRFACVPTAGRSGSTAATWLSSPSRCWMQQGNWCPTLWRP